MAASTAPCASRSSCPPSGSSRNASADLPDRTAFAENESKSRGRARHASPAAAPSPCRSLVNGLIPHQPSDRHDRHHGGGNIGGRRRAPRQRLPDRMFRGNGNGRTGPDENPQTTMRLGLILCGETDTRPLHPPAGLSRLAARTSRHSRGRTARPIPFHPRSPRESAVRVRPGNRRCHEEENNRTVTLGGTCQKMTFRRPRYRERVPRPRRSPRRQAQFAGGRG